VNRDEAIALMVEAQMMKLFTTVSTEPSLLDRAESAMRDALERELGIGSYIGMEAGLREAAGVMVDALIGAGALSVD
jgi:hypothetical protein